MGRESERWISPFHFEDSSPPPSEKDLLEEEEVKHGDPGMTKDVATDFVLRGTSIIPSCPLLILGILVLFKMEQY